MHKQRQIESETATGWTAREAYMLAVISLFAGLALGYMIRGSSASVANQTATAAIQPAMPVGNQVAPATDVEATAAPLKLALSSDPRNYDLLVQLGNLYYDKQVYSPAIDYYRRAVELRPKDVNVRTDLGTAYWYSGLPENAINEYKKSLQVDPGHPQTLFNMGVVYKDGLKDPANAISTWETLLKLHSDYPDRQRVLGLIEEARKQTS
jgi:tetratricopeptide (TPR) repeat protein